MDFFAHAAWSYIVFHRIKKPFLAIFFGLLPDLASWFIFLIYNLISGISFGRPDLATIPPWVHTLYGISHSLIVVAVIFLIILLLFRKIPFYLLAWPLHILCDIPTHSRDFLPTPFLWPISAWKFPGFSWSEPWFMITNWSIILICLIIIFIINRKNKEKIKK